MTDRDQSRVDRPQLGGPDWLSAMLVAVVASVIALVSIAGDFNPSGETLKPTASACQPPNEPAIPMGGCSWAPIDALPAALAVVVVAVVAVFAAQRYRGGRDNA